MTAKREYAWYLVEDALNESGATEGDVKTIIEALGEIEESNEAAPQPER